MDPKDAKRWCYIFDEKQILQIFKNQKMWDYDLN